ncbi:MAG: ATP synthase F1 subunit delta [Acidobacteriota bacterium]|nr:ATP synthase F1 subunit delta [Acidobacteriota bacterium]
MEELARVYGRSLFEVASSADKRDLVREQLGQVADAVGESQELRVFLFSPHFSTQEKKSGLARAIRDADEVLVRFLDLLIEKHRMPVLLRIRQDFDRRCEEAEALLSVEITSAVELDAKTAANVAEQIGAHTGMRVDLRRHVDPEIIGGLILRVGNSILDASVRGRLERLRHQVAKAA